MALPLTIRRERPPGNRSTEADSTPSRAETASSTAWTQCPQVKPATVNSTAPVPATEEEGREEQQLQPVADEVRGSWAWFSDLSMPVPFCDEASMGAGDDGCEGGCTAPAGTYQVTDNSHNIPPGGINSKSGSRDLQDAFGEGLTTLGIRHVSGHLTPWVQTTVPLGHSIPLRAAPRARQRCESAAIYRQKSQDSACAARREVAGRKLSRRRPSDHVRNSQRRTNRARRSALRLSRTPRVGPHRARRAGARQRCSPGRRG